jgi:hypothetical protein
MRFLVDGRSYALRWYSVDCVGVALVVARAVVGAREGVCVVGSYVVGGVVGEPVGTVWRIASG